MMLDEFTLHDIVLDLLRSELHQFMSSAILQDQFVRGKTNKKESIANCGYEFEFWFRYVIF